MTDKTTKKRTSRYEVKSSKPIPELHQGCYHVLNAENGRGKTHYLNVVSKSILRDLNLKYKEECLDKSLNSPNLICLSGTCFDKFDKYATFKVYLNKNERANCFYYYTGYSKNNNSFSPQIPFRTLFEVLANSFNKNSLTNLDERIWFLAEKLVELKFKNYLKVFFSKN